MIHRIFNLCLRGGGMVGKFLLIFFLARILSPEEVGVYGLFAATIGYALYLLGLDFYTYSNRELLNTAQENWPEILKHQFFVFICCLVVVFPCLSLIFITDILPINYIILFYFLLAAEYLSQELNRLMIIVGKPIAGGIFTFIRSGAWCFTLVAIYLSGLLKINLSSVILSWGIADTIVLIGGAFLLKKLPWGNLTLHINWLWIYRGLKVAALLLVGTLALRGLFIIDRYFVDILFGKELLGVYTLYISICFSIIGFVDALVFSFRYPALITLYKSDQQSAFNSASSEFGYQTLIAVTLLTIFVIIIIPPLLQLIGKPIYLNFLPLFYILLTASVIFVIGHIPHYILYAMGEDRSIVKAHIVGLIVFTVLSLILIKRYEVFSIAIALLISITLVGIIKQLTVIKLRKNYKNIIPLVSANFE